ncbi:MAG: phosphatase PAP2 family protein [Actinobacteria bacterium]|nr:phosphatase PAP2 family protein [Actinomycetota bacterium]
MQSLKEFGQLVAIFVAFLLIFILDKPRRRMLPKLLLCVLLPSVLVWPTKLGVHRLRPHCTDEYSTTLGLGFFLGREPQKPNPALPLAVQGKIEADHKLDSSDIASFPSAHTATAFAFAVGLSALYPSARVVFYALAAGCGCQRIIFGAHWFSDVVAGLLIGLLTARVVWLWPDKTIGELFGKIWSRSRDSQRQNNQDLQ